MKVNVQRNVKSLDALSKKLAEPREFLDLLGQSMLAAAHKRIQTTKRDANGRAWAPWATSTARARRKSGSAGRGLLYNTGALDRSLTYTVQGPKVSVQTASPYARYLQNGTNRMPARPFLGFGKVEEEATQAIWTKWMSDINKE
jgi:phage gpG-like protein